MVHSSFNTGQKLLILVPKPDRSGSRARRQLGRMVHHEIEASQVSAARLTQLTSGKLFELREEKILLFGKRAAQSCVG